MSHGEVSSTQSHKKKSSILKIQILIVDDDATSLAIISSMLTTCSLEDHVVKLVVVAVKNSSEALSTLRTRHDVFDLVITDLHMHGINGLELQKQINEEFKIPVIIMSSDDKESVILEVLESGAVFYMIKPVSQQDLNNVWQYAIEIKKGKSIVIETMGNNDHEASGSNVKNHNEDINSTSSTNEENANNKKKKGKKRARDDQDEDAPSAPKKAKVVWTNSLHNRFLQAINHIGLEKAVPKRILEFMGVPGLTRENVASHLQKYRMFLKKVAERGLWSSQTLSERALRSSFAAGLSSMFFKNPSEDYSQFPGSHQFRPTFQPGYGGNFYGFGSSNYGFSHYPNQEASTSNSVPQFCYGQSGLFGNNPSSFQQQLVFDNTSSLYQPNRTIYGLLTANPNGLNSSTNALDNVANGLNIAATNPMQMYQQQNQAISNPPTYFQFGATRIGSSNYTSTVSGMGTSNSSYTSSLNPNGNYGGIRLTSDGELIRSRQVRFNGNEPSSNGFNNAYGSGLMNWNHNNNDLGSAHIGNSVFSYLPPQGGSSSTGFGSYLSRGASSSTGYGNANPFSSTFNATSQENASIVPPFSQQHTNANLGYDGGENDFSLNLLSNDFSFDNISNNQQELSEGDLNEFLFGSINLTTHSQQQGVDEVLNANFPSSPYHAEANSSIFDLLNAEFSSSCAISDGTLWNKQSTGQVQGREETLTINSLGGNVNSVVDNYCFNPSIEQAQNCNNEEPDDSKPDENAAFEDQCLGEDFLDFLLGNEPYY